MRGVFGRRRGGNGRQLRLRPLCKVPNIVRMLPAARGAKPAVFTSTSACDVLYLSRLEVERTARLAGNCIGFCGASHLPEAFILLSKLADGHGHGAT
jgi:hypothetical protein